MKRCEAGFILLRFASNSIELFQRRAKNADIASRAITIRLKLKKYIDEKFLGIIKARGILLLILAKANRKVPILHNEVLYSQRHKIKIMLARLKNWRRFNKLYDRFVRTSSQP